MVRYYGTVENLYGMVFAFFSTVPYGTQSLLLLVVEIIRTGVSPYKPDSKVSAKIP